MKYWIIFFTTLTASFAKGQSLPIPTHSPFANEIERSVILLRPEQIHSSVKPLQLNDALLLQTAKDSLNNFTKTEQHLSRNQASTLAALKTTDGSKSLHSKWLYSNPAYLYHHQGTEHFITVNPLFQFDYGKSGNENLLQNNRGLEMNIGIDNKVFIYTSILESQVGFTDFITDRTERFRAIPGNGFYKNYSSKIFKINNGYDFNNAQGIISASISKHIGFQFGYGKNVIGDGIRSMFLSDYSNNYLHLKLNTRFWKFHYQNIFGELQAQGSRDDIGDELIPRKYFSAHYLSFKPNKAWRFGLYETVVFSRRDHFDFAYMNPVILFRTVEGMLGSPDNVLLGLDVSWQPLNGLQFYGQCVLDEFIFKELFLERRNWWGNKYALQTGIKYLNAFGVNRLDLQVEANAIRPYTYTHNDSTANYTNYNQPLAHPLGANLIEFIGTISYRPIPKLHIRAWGQKYAQGLDSNGLNYGENILTESDSRISEYNNNWLQGNRTNVNRLTLALDYEIWPQIYLNAQYTYRNQQQFGSKNTSFYTVGLLVNSWFRPQLL